jgi:hypothetical protein
MAIKYLTIPSNTHPNFLGKGTYKSVWKLNDFAVVNATDKQRGLDRGYNQTQANESNKPIQMEYNFTVYLHNLFTPEPNCPFKIPKVYLFQNPKIFRPQILFRYAKELCGKVDENDNLVNQMIAITDYLSEKGWVYLDMKPSNLGMLDRKICIVDTDYKHFYRVPDHLKEDFRNWSYLIIVMYAYLFLKKVTKETLLQIINKKNITEEMLMDLWKKQVDDDAAKGSQVKKADKIVDDLIDHGNKHFIQDTVQPYIKLEKGDIVCPYLVYLQYGQPVQPTQETKLNLPLSPFQNMMKYVKSTDKTEPPAKPKAPGTTGSVRDTKGPPPRARASHKAQRTTNSNNGTQKNKKPAARPHTVQVSRHPRAQPAPPPARPAPHRAQVQPRTAKPAPKKI